MTARDLATVLLRIGGLYLLIQVIAALPSVFSAVPDLLAAFRETKSVASGHPMENWRAAFFVMWPVALYATVGLWLVFSAPRVARLIAPAGTAVPSTLVVGQEFQAVAISILGLFLLATTVPHAAQTAVALAFAARFRGTPLVGQYWDRITFGGLLELGASVVVGTWLCLGARGIAAGIRSLRSGNAVPGEQRVTPS